MAIRLKGEKKFMPNEKKDSNASVYVKFDSVGKVLGVYALNIPENYVFRTKSERLTSNAFYYICANKAILTEMGFKNEKREGLDFHADLPIPFTKLDIRDISNVPLKVLKPELESLVISRINSLFNCSDISETKKNELLEMAYKATMKEYFIIENYLVRTF